MSVLLLWRGGWGAHHTLRVLWRPKMGAMPPPLHCWLAWSVAGPSVQVHVECLRRWQRAVLVTQPTHPAFYSHDQRQDICNVCKGRFDPPPPTRAVLMAGFTGGELASLLEEGRLIVCEPRTSRHMEAMVGSRGGGSLRHWIRGVFLITQARAHILIEQVAFASLTFPSPTYPPPISGGPWGGL